MKKYTLNALAITSAIGISAFNNFKEADIRFEYQLTSFSQAQVQNHANYAPGSSLVCNAFDKACQITVHESNTLNNGTQLDANKVAIVAQDSDANNHWGIDNVTTQYGTPTWGNKD